MTFWQGKKVFITGHTGFKGSWLSLWLQSLGAEVIGFSLEEPPTPINLFTLARVAEGMTNIIGDVRDFRVLQQALVKHNPDMVIHMAAQPLVRYSYQEPVLTYATNVMGTVHVLEAIRKLDNVKVFINVTTDKCYENKESVIGYHEEDRLGGYDPYSNSKACAELVTHAYRSSYFSEKGIATVRAGNVIGGGDWALDRLIPDIMQACINQQSLLIRNPHALRPWQHVLDPLGGYLLLAEHLWHSPEEFSGSWNFGPHLEDIQSVSWIVEYIVKRWNHQAGWSIDGASQPHETTMLKLDCTKAKTKLKWEPKLNLEKGLQQTIQWYQAYQTQKNMRDETLTQIHAYDGIS